MATKSFAINTEPHVAKIGDGTLSIPARGHRGEFVQAYAGLRVDAQKFRASRLRARSRQEEDVKPSSL